MSDEFRNLTPDFFPPAGPGRTRHKLGEYRLDPCVRPGASGSVEAMAGGFRLGPWRRRTARSPIIPVALAADFASGQYRQPVLPSHDRV